jgi:hypothetical protein
MIYAADFHALDFAQRPSVPLGDGVERRDELDFADIVSEAEHHYRIQGAPGFVAMKLLESPGRAGNELWDAGRVVPPNVTVEGLLSGFASGKPARLLIRTAPVRPARLRFRVNGSELPEVSLSPGNHFTETFVDVPAALVRNSLAIAITAEGEELVLYHLWGVQAR